MAQVDDDLDQESDENWNRGRGPYRTSPMLPSGELQREAENEPARGPCGDNGPERLPEVGYGPKAPRRRRFSLIEHAVTGPGWTSDRGQRREHLRA
jgi:hypothetical protein